jgi:hypothetical protein
MCLWVPEKPLGVELTPPWADRGFPSSRPSLSICAKASTVRGLGRVPFVHNGSRLCGSRPGAFVFRLEGDLVD